MRFTYPLLLLLFVSTSLLSANDFVGNWIKIGQQGNMTRISVYESGYSVKVVAHFGRRALAYTKVHTFKSSDGNVDLIIARKDTKKKTNRILGDAPIGTTYNFLILEKTAEDRLSAHCCKEAPAGNSMHYKADFKRAKQVSRRKVKPAKEK